jgi:hypothetical protein
MRKQVEIPAIQLTIFRGHSNIITYFYYKVKVAKLLRIK